jgi:tetratricopeptide (TPR) repeat protein
MSKEEKEEKSTSIFDFFSNFDKSTQVAYIISRFYYQIIGIYFPAVLLVLFSYFYYKDILSSFYHPLTEGLKNFQFDQWYLTLFVFIGIVIIVGEAINAISSRVTFLSPGPIRRVDLVKSILGIKITREWLNRVKWPIWFGIADYPIPFSSFDRYFLESLDKEKRSLAGKIGWTTFFRNMVFVLSIIFLTGILLYVTILGSTTNNTFIQNFNLDITKFPEYISQPEKTLFIPLWLPLVLTVLFYLGYRSNRRSYGLVYWKSYRRNEYIKWFEVKYGSLENVFKIKSDSYQQAINFVTDKLYIASDMYLLNFSSIIMTKLEDSYLSLNEIVDKYSDSDLTCGYHKRYPADQKPGNFVLACSYCRGCILQKLKETSVIMNYCYKEWRYGSHEIVLEKCFSGLECLGFVTFEGFKARQSARELTRPEFWQEMRGFLLIAETFCMESAFADIELNLKNWNWINPSTNNDNKSDNSYSKMYRNLIVSFDEWDRAITNITSYFQLNSPEYFLGSPFLEEFKNVNILRNFGGYNYGKCIDDLALLNYRLNNNDYAWNDIVFTYDNKWKVIGLENHVLKLVPVKVTSNLKIEMQMRPNSEKIKDLPKFLYEINHDEIKSLPSFKELMGKDVLVMNGLASLIKYTYKKDNTEILGYNILFPYKKNERLYFIKYEEEKGDESSVDYLEKMLESITPDIAKFFNTANSLFETGKYAKAIMLYDKVLEYDPNDLTALISKGASLSNLDRYEEALENYDKAIEVNPNEPRIYYNRGTALAALGRLEEALENYDKAIELDPNDANCYSEMASVLGSLKRYEEALENYDKAIELDPDDVIALDNRGYMLFELNRINEAVEQSEIVVEYYENYANGWYNRAVYLLADSRNDEALLALNKAIKLDPSCAAEARNDMDFNALKNDDRFKQLVATNVNPLNTGIV